MAGHFPGGGNPVLVGIAAIIVALGGPTGIILLYNHFSSSDRPEPPKPTPSPTSTPTASPTPTASSTSQERLVELDQSRYGFYGWEAVSENQAIQTDVAAFVGREDDEDRFVCRAMFGAKFRVGKTVRGKCNLTVYETLTLSEDGIPQATNANERIEETYEFLSISADNHYWLDIEEFTESDYKALGIVMERGQTLICRTQYQNAEHPGVVENKSGEDGKFVCVFSYDGRIKYAPSPDNDSPFDLLVVENQAASE